MEAMNPASSPSPLSPFQGFALGWSRYAEFRGRSSRVEFWSFQIINFFLSFFLSLFSLGILGVLFWLAVLIPSTSVWVRRVHDINCSGWWIFWALASWIIIPLVPLVFGVGSDVIASICDGEMASKSIIASICDVTESGAASPTGTGDLAKYGVLAFYWSIGFIIVMNFIPFIMCFVDSNPGTNKYGPNPKLNPTNPNNTI